MLALYRAGRQADALELYKETRRAFVERLGIEPTPRLRELEQAILAQDPELDAGLPRLRPPAVLRGRSRRVALGLAAVCVAVVAGTATILLARGDGGTVLAIPGTVVVVDPESARVVDTVEVGSGPVAIVSGHESIWVANAGDDTITRIDPTTRNVLATIGVASPVDLAVGADAIWVASGIAGTVSRIDPESNDVVATIDLRGRDPFVPRTVQGIAVGYGTVWACAAGRELVRIDPGQDRVVRSIDVGSAPLAVTTGYGAVWLVTAGGQLLRIEPTTDAVTAKLSVGSPGNFPHDVATSDDGILVLVSDIWLVDPESTRLDRTLSLGRYIVAVADEPGAGLWAVTYEGVLERVHPDLEEPPLRARLGPGPTAVAIAGGAVWVTVGEPEP